MSYKYIGLYYDSDGFTRIRKANTKKELRYCVIYDARKEADKVVSYDKWYGGLLQYQPASDTIAHLAANG